MFLSHAIKNCAPSLLKCLLCYKIIAIYIEVFMKTKDFKVRHFCISLAAAFFAIAVVFASCINSVSYKKSSSVAVVLPASRAILEDTATSASFNGGTFAISITGTGGG